MTIAVGDGVVDEAAAQLDSYSSRLLQRQANHTEVNRLRAEGMGIRAIGRALALSRNTVRSYLRTDRLPAQVFPRTRPTHLVAQDAFLQAGRRFSARQTMWLLRRAAADLTHEEQRYVDALLATSPEIALAHRLTLAFLALVQQRDASALPGWLEAATQSGLAPFHSFAVGIRRDYAAVEAARTLPLASAATTPPWKRRSRFPGARGRSKGTSTGSNCSNVKAMDGRALRCCANACCMRRSITPGRMSLDPWLHAPWQHRMIAQY